MTIEEIVHGESRNVEFKVTLNGEASEKHQDDFGDDLNRTQKQILELLSQDARLSAKKISEKID